MRAGGQGISVPAYMACEPADWEPHNKHHACKSTRRRRRRLCRKDKVVEENDLKMKLTTSRGRNTAATVLSCLFYYLSLVLAYHHSPCKGRAIRAQFQFEDCYIPPLSSSLLLTEASFLMSHDAGTGYIHAGDLSKTGLSWPYSKNQVGSVYQQLNDGARALDLRPKLLTNGTVIFQHGVITIPITFQDLIADAVRWCQEKGQDELVLLLASNFAYEESSSSTSSSSAYQNNNNNDNDDTLAIVSAMSAVYQEMGVTYLHCNQIYGLTVGDAMDHGALPSGGYLLAIDGQDYYGSFCGKSNWVESQLVTCWDGEPSNGKSCKSGSKEPLQRLTDYVVASANNPATDDSSTLGPPSNLYDYPFNEIQALWQVDTHAATIGMAHFSSILDDNQQSAVNEHMVQLIYEEKLNGISLFAIDNVALNGNALLSVLRNSCGQTDLPVCGKEIDPPKIKYWHVTTKQLFGILLGIYFVWFLFSFTYRKYPKLLNTLTARIQESINQSIIIQQKELLVRMSCQPFDEKGRSSDRE